MGAFMSLFLHSSTVYCKHDCIICFLNLLIWEFPNVYYMASGREKKIVTALSQLHLGCSLLTTVLMNTANILMILVSLLAFSINRYSILAMPV